MVLEFVNKYAGNVHSQNGEDGIIQECVKRLGLMSGSCCEIGGNDGLWLSNTRLLLENGWSGTLVEASWPLSLKSQANWSHRKDVKSTCARVDGHSVNFYVKDNCDLLSVDTDGEDFGIFRGMEAKPKIVIVEIDSRIPPDKDEFSAQGGAGFRPMVKLGIEKGYFLLCHVGNLIFIDEKYRDLFPEITEDPLTNPEAYFLDAILTGDRSYLKTA